MRTNCNFGDRLVIALDPGHARDATRYEAAMRQRNRLLTEPRADADWLAALEAAMVVQGLALAERRGTLVAELGEALAATPAGPFARAGLAHADKVLIAVGRRAHTTGFGFETLDLTMSGAFVRIDATCASEISRGAGRPGISAVVMTMSCLAMCPDTSSACAALYSSDISVA